MFLKDVGSGEEADYDMLGSVVYRGQDSNGNLATFTRIVGKSLDVTDSTEDGQLVIDVMKSGDGKTLMNAQIVKNSDAEKVAPVDKIKVKDKG